MFAHTMLIFDHVTHTIKVLSHVRPGGDVDSEYAEAVGRIDSLVERLRLSLDPSRNVNAADGVHQSLRSNVTREQFEESVGTRERPHLRRRGHPGGAVAAASRQTIAEPFEIYSALRTINPSPYMFYLDFGEFQLVGASPEILVRVEDGKVMTRPLAGTRRRGTTAAEDLRWKKNCHGRKGTRRAHHAGGPWAQRHRASERAGLRRGQRPDGMSSAIRT